MKLARVIVLGVALAAAGGAAMLASRGWQAEQPKAPAVPQIATVDVLVAKNNLAVGQAVGGKDIAWQIWPADSAGNFIKKTDRPDAIKEFEGGIARAPVMAGEPIRDNKVVIAKGAGFLAAILPHGMRAISLDVAPDTGAGGFILPNDHVDVVLTRRDKRAEKLSGEEKFVSETILKNVRVLAVDQTVEERMDKKSSSARPRRSRSTRARRRRSRSRVNSAKCRSHYAACSIRNRRLRKGTMTASETAGPSTQCVTA